MIYAFEGCELDTRRFELRRDGHPYPLEPQVFDVLAYLVAHHDRVVTRQELFDHVWPEGFVTDSALSSRLMAARKAIGDSGEAQRLIRTIHRRGFRFVAPVEERPDSGEVAATPSTTAIAPVAVDGRPEVDEAPLIVGRQLERARLHRWVAEATAGRLRIIFLEGEPGIGKTTLVRGLLDSLRAQDSLLVAQGQCVAQHGSGEPYLPVLEALGDACRGPRADEVVGLLIRHAPTWIAQLPWLLDAATLAAVKDRLVGTTRERMLREFTEMLRALTVQWPLLLVLEDLHWSDPSTVDLLVHLARNSTPQRLAVLGTYRPSDLRAIQHPLLSVLYELRLRDQCRNLTLGPLGEREVGQFVAAQLGSVPDIASIAQVLHRRTAGNPLFMMSVLRHWSDQGLVTSHGTSTFRAELGRAMPPDLRAMILQQISDLPALERAFVEAASVAGREFCAAVAAAALGLAEDEAELTLDAFSQHGTMLQRTGAEAWPDGTVSTRYAFTHDLYLEVTYDQLPAGRRAQLHRAIGARLEAAYGEQLTQATVLAEHFARGQDHARAAEYLRLAGQHALDRSAYHEAVQHLLAALEHLPYLADERARTRQELLVQAMLGPALVVTRGWADPTAEQALTRACGLGYELDDRRTLSQVLYRLATLHELRGEYAMTQRVLAERAQIIAGEDQTAPLVESHELLACSTFHEGRFLDAERHAAEGLTLYDHGAHRALSAFLGENPAVSCHHWSALSSWFLGYPDRALRQIEEALHLAEDLGHWFSLAHAQEQAACLHQLRGEAAEALRRAEATVVLGDRQGFPYRVATGSILRGWALAVQGETAEGIAQLRAGLASCRELGARIDYPYFLALLAEALLVTAAQDEALQVIDEALDVATLGRGFFYAAELYRLRGLALLGTSIPAASLAEPMFRRALDLSRQQHARSLELRVAINLARLALDTGHPDGAREALASVYGCFTEGFETRDLQEARRLLDALGPVSTSIRSR